MSFTRHRSIADLTDVEDSLAFALTQLRAPLDRSLVCREFWHALNRRGVVKNELVDGWVFNTLQKARLLDARVEEKRKMRDETERRLSGTYDL